MRVLLDTNIVLDLLLDRDRFAEDAALIWEANARGEIEAFIAAITPVNVFYIARKLKGAELARQYVGKLLTSLKVCSLNQQVLLAAEILPLKDYEDAVQFASALFNQLDAVITRNLKDFTNSTLPVFSSSELVVRLKLKE